MLVLRPAGPHDERRLLEWRNEPGVRDASFSSNEISLDQHHRWFVRKLRDPRCALLIVEDDGQPVGQVRLDRLDAEIAEISVGLAPDARGRGVGRQALALAVAQAGVLLGVTSVKAFVKDDNETSLRAFRAAGFHEVTRDGGVIELRVGAG